MRLRISSGSFVRNIVCIRGKEPDVDDAGLEALVNSIQEISISPAMTNKALLVTLTHGELSLGLTR